MGSRLRTGRKIAKVSVIFIFALTLLTSPAWAQSGSVSGTVIDADGNPLPGVAVSLLNEDGSSAGEVVTSDATGAFSITGVETGSYTATANLDGFQPASQPVQMTASAQLTVDFRMSPPFHGAVMVTAQKVEENILDVPMTITAFDAETREKLIMQTQIDLQDLTPGLQFGDETEQAGWGTVIRGIGTQSAAGNHADLGVATYVDGAYTLGTYGTAPGGGFDLKRVEVARGPQGTLHGRNSVAGAINLINTKPSNQWDATLMGEVTDVSQQRLNAAVGGPIGGAFSFRFTGGIHTGDGRQENIGVGPDNDAPDQTFWAPQLRVQTNRFDMNVRWSHVEDEGVPRTMVNLTNFDTTTPGGYWGDEWFANPYYLYETPNPAIDPNCPVGTPGFICGDVNNSIAQNFDSRAASESDLGTLYAQYQISDGLALRYNFSYSDVAMINYSDGDYSNRVPVGENPGTMDHTIASDGLVTPFENSSYELPFEYEEYSHELTFSSSFSGPFNFIGGAFYYDNERSWAINSFDYAAPFRFGTADEQARANSPIFGFWPAEGCQDVLTMIDTMGWGNIYPERAHEMEGLYIYCPEGDEHTRMLEWYTRSRADTWAAFFSGDYRFNEHWGLSGGVRYTEDTKEQLTTDVSGYMLNDTWYGSLIGMTFLTGEGYDAPATWSQPIGHLALEYTTDSGDLIYGRISTGYRAGGFNITDVPGSVPAFIDQETLINYELGGKGLFLNQRLQLSAALWFYDFQDYQYQATMEQPEGVDVPVSIWSDTPLLYYTTNVPDTKVWGADFEFSWFFTNHWSLRGFYAYQDSEIGELEYVVPGDPNPEYGEHTYFDFSIQDWLTVPYQLPKDVTGNALPMQPKNKLAMTLGFNTGLGRTGGDLSLFATYTFTDERYNDIGNILLYELPAYDRFDASVTWTAPGRKWSLTLFGKNLADEIGIVEFVPELGVGAGSLAYLTHGREIGLQLYWRPFN